MEDVPVTDVQQLETNLRCRFRSISIASERIQNCVEYRVCLSVSGLHELEPANIAPVIQEHSECRPRTSCPF